MNDVTKDLLVRLRVLLSLHDARVDTADAWNLSMEEARAAITRAEAALDHSADIPSSVDERRLRRMLCLHRHGASAYMDDGEATFGGDEFQRPTDYLRESLDSIEQAWIEAGLKQVAQAEPQPDADGWIPWAGGDEPVGRDTPVDLRYRDSEIWPDKLDVPSGYCHLESSEPYWRNDGGSSDIIAYRVVKL